MITKGIVEEIDNYLVKVRLPVFDKIAGAKNATLTQDLSDATICCQPNSKYQVSVGDVVFVGFEDNDISKPIILGQLYRDVDSNTFMSLVLSGLETKSTTTLSKDTTIGEVKSSEIECLKNVKTNIQQQLNELIDRVNKLEEV